MSMWLYRKEELKRQISSLQKMTTTSSVASLPDGGAKLHSRLASLHQELANLDGTGRMLFAHIQFVPLTIPLQLHTAQLLVCARLVYAQHTLQWQSEDSSSLYCTLPASVVASDADCLAQSQMP